MSKTVTYNENGKTNDWETVVEMYREKNPEETEGLEDVKVLKIVAKEIHLRAQSHYEKNAAKMNTAANEKRDKLIENLSEKDAQHVPDLKELLKTIPDSVILDKDYIIEHSLHWARGRHFSPDKIAEIEKAAELKGFERGRASKRIISGPSGAGRRPTGGGAVMKWTEDEKSTAAAQYPNVVDEKERYKLFDEVRQDRANKKKVRDQKK